MTPFVFPGIRSRVVFGFGTMERLTGEIERLGRRRALVLSTPQQREAAEVLAARLGNGAAVFSQARMHTPVEVTETAVEALHASGADCVVSYGGGSTTGLGKAIALRTGTDQIAVPTTYAGSEMTDILGETQGGEKTTRRDAAILPETVVYDVETTLTLPVTLSVTSGINAIAHAVEGLYAPDRNPITTLMASDAIRALAAALPAIAARPDDRDARSDALYGAFLCGAVLGSVSMALHHKLCHALGGAFDLPHAETHTVILPHSTAYNAQAVGNLLDPVTAALGGERPGAALFDLARRSGAPVALRELGFREQDIGRAADLVMKNPYGNPRPLEREAIQALIRDAWAGERPAG